MHGGGGGGGRGLDPEEDVFALFPIGFRLYLSLYLKKKKT